MISVLVPPRSMPKRSAIGVLNLKLHRPGPISGIQASGGVVPGKWPSPVTSQITTTPCRSITSACSRLAYNKKRSRRRLVNSVLYPAIPLMHGLSFGMKFSLISGRFFLPMLVTNYFQVRASYDAFVDTRTELQSLELLRQSQKMRQELE